MESRVYNNSGQRNTHYNQLKCTSSCVTSQFDMVSLSVCVCSVGAAADDLQQEEEDLDDVSVEGQSSKHILLGTQAMSSVPQQQLSVICQELHTHTHTDYIDSALTLSVCFQCVMLLY